MEKVGVADRPPDLEAGNLRRQWRRGGAPPSSQIGGGGGSRQQSGVERGVRGGRPARDRDFVCFLHSEGPFVVVADLSPAWEN